MEPRQGTPRNTARLVWWVGFVVLLTGWLIEIYPVMGLGSFLFGYGCCELDQQ